MRNLSPIVGRASSSEEELEATQSLVQLRLLGSPSLRGKRSPSCTDVYQYVTLKEKDLAKHHLLDRVALIVCDVPVWHVVRY